jgi:hypothetical protein
VRSPSLTILSKQKTGSENQLLRKEKHSGSHHETALIRGYVHDVHFWLDFFRNPAYTKAYSASPIPLFRREFRFPHSMVLLISFRRGGALGEAPSVFQKMTVFHGCQNSVLAPGYGSNSFQRGEFALNAPRILDPFGGSRRQVVSANLPCRRENPEKVIGNQKPFSKRTAAELPGILVYFQIVGNSQGTQGNKEGAETNNPNKKMKIVINNKRYSTETATLVASWSNGAQATDFRHCSKTLYKTLKGAYFLYEEGGPMSEMAQEYPGGRRGRAAIRPLTAEEAMHWLESHNQTEALEREFPSQIQDA